ncbi:MAG TPA: extracellular solute-binding protein [Candidatus Dormibacteraeota bacterium]|nr:extracellular solute-binding protein [Candidatus Dormibacteraeota bacterium]
MRSTYRFLAPLMVLGLLLAACTAATPGASTADGSQEPGASQGEEDLTGAEVTVIGTWTDAEQESFLAMVAPWEEQTGATVKYQGTRSINDILAAGIPTGVLPDLAGLPGPGQMAEYVAAGALKPLDDVLDIETYVEETSPGLVALGQVDGVTYGTFIKSAVKGLIWYNPTLHDYAGSEPATWDDLIAEGEANQGDAEGLWCLGIESGDASGWPATDWIEEILLHQAGPDVYNQWWAGEVAWTDPAIQTAFETFMNDVVANTYGGGTTAVATKFDLAGDPLFASPPGCALFHQASFITGLGAFVGKTAGTDYNAFPFPAFNDEFATAVEGAGDLFGMFHDTPAAKSLMRYLVTADAQDIWVARGGALSANKNATSYPDDISTLMGGMITGAEQFVFDASDQMPTAMGAAFLSHLVSLTAGSETVEEALAELQTVADDAYSE